MKTAAVLPLIAVLAVNAKLRPSTATEQPIPADDDLMVRSPIYTDPLIDPIYSDPSTLIHPHGPFKPPMKIPSLQLNIKQQKLPPWITPTLPTFPTRPTGILNLNQKLPPWVDTLLPVDDFDGTIVDPVTVEEEEASEVAADDELLIMRDPSPFNPLNPLKHKPLPIRPLLKLYQKKQLPPYIDTFFPVEDEFGAPIYEPVPVEEKTTEPVAEDDELVVRSIGDIVDPFDPLGDPFDPLGPIGPHRPPRPFPTPTFPFPTGPIILNLNEKHLPPYVDTFFPVEDSLDEPIVDVVPAEEATEAVANDDELIVRNPIGGLNDPFNPLGPKLPPWITPTFPTRPILQFYQKDSAEEEVLEVEPVENVEDPIICHLPPPEEAYIDEPEMVIDPAPIEEPVIVLNPQGTW